MLFSETWLTPLTPDRIVSLDGFHLLWADRTRESTSGHISIKEKLVDIELLAVSLRPYVLHSVTSKLQTQHPQALLLISGDFNHVSPSSTVYFHTVCHLSHQRQ